MWRLDPDGERGEPADERGWSDARFYKGRVFSPDYE
ncbi:hypothetical protein SACE_4629 [Saccharopolyspora erythraea NRRL 2338]|uniref:Uncharacterized protein n=1 Tax=Saccharopolyspora erythraea (strain ATCC 11635 / DSM 40517 / JCM 4748 / NBRC 13426 / NCIMB 8594 / NRRL 2338) TaxID=405948 RepID=A4FIM3_SACEN|nr:hypothetical protein N599_01870 [Saccharopolyspora erythraea D]CAM03898.1 hypothetical protein SACE_4629 [Saccharopolyspora erythraea NRRL 2338]